MPLTLLPILEKRTLGVVLPFSRCLIVERVLNAPVLIGPGDNQNSGWPCSQNFLMKTSTGAPRTLLLSMNAAATRGVIA